MIREPVTKDCVRDMAKDLFGINDKEIDSIFELMEKDYKTPFDAIDDVIDSKDLTYRQKMFVSFIVGSICTTSRLQGMSKNKKDDYNIPNTGINIGM